MHKKDLLFLAHLRKNARETLTDISKKINVPISTLFDRLRHHEKTVIRKHTALIDFAQLGYLCKAMIAFRVAREERESVKEYLMATASINSLFRINNGFDFLVEGVFESVKEMEDFLEQAESKFSILGKQVYYVIEDVKREQFLADPDLVKNCDVLFKATA